MSNAVARVARRRYIYLNQLAYSIIFLAEVFMVIKFKENNRITTNKRYSAKCQQIRNHLIKYNKMIYAYKLT